jgi:hypothetical protein
MLERVGNVLYWIGCSLAALIVGLGAFVYLMEGKTRSDGIGMFAGFCVAAFLAWITGRGLRYILGGR